MSVPITKYYKLKINSVDYIFTKSFTLSQLVEYLGFNQQVIVIDYNGYILEKKVWLSTFLQTGDSLEIVSIAGGG
jgi:sulfur carrier protein